MYESIVYNYNARNVVTFTLLNVLLIFIHLRSVTLKFYFEFLCKSALTKNKWRMEYQPGSQTLGEPWVLGKP
jgi:hypothetical protein